MSFCQYDWACSNLLCEKKHPFGRHNFLKKISTQICKNEELHGGCIKDGCGYMHTSVCPIYGNDCHYLKQNTCHHKAPEPVKMEHCKYGADCYNNSPQHVATHTHPKGWKPCVASSGKQCKDLSCQWCKIDDDVEFVSVNEQYDPEEDSEESEFVDEDDIPYTNETVVPVGSTSWAKIAAPVIPEVVVKPTVPTSEGKEEKEDFPSLTEKSVDKTVEAEKVEAEKPVEKSDKKVMKIKSGKKVDVKDVLKALIAENEDLILEMIAKRIAKRSAVASKIDDNEAILSKWREQALASSGKSWADDYEE